MRIVEIIIGIQIIGTLAAIGVIVYLIIRRRRIRGKEDFERRAN